MLISVSQFEWKSEYLEICLSDSMHSWYGLHKFVYDSLQQSFSTLCDINVCGWGQVSQRTQLDVSMFWRCGHGPMMLRVFHFLPESSHFQFITRCAWQYHWFPTWTPPFLTPSDVLHLHFSVRPPEDTRVKLLIPLHSPPVALTLRCVPSKFNFMCCFQIGFKSSVR